MYIGQPGRKVNRLFAVWPRRKVDQMLFPSVVEPQISRSVSYPTQTRHCFLSLSVPSVSSCSSSIRAIRSHPWLEMPSPARVFPPRLTACARELQEQLRVDWNDHLADALLNPF